jgi:eukaryotic-like serine/threonine-protein kinase
MDSAQSSGDDQTTLSEAPGSSGAAGPSPDRTVFQPGDVLARHYRIVRFLAAGGMGEVYEAEDLELGSRIALKSMGPRLAANQRSAMRFRREILLARQVTHENVCRIFDLGIHAAPVGAVPFLTMELLTGKTLAELLRSRGPLPEAEAAPLARQMCAALAAAHRAGVVHRDFKSQNVLLVPPSSDRPTANLRPAVASASLAGTDHWPLAADELPLEASQPTLATPFRVVVTDFGLARSSLGDRSGQSLTGGAMLGTPAYMAPEQVQGLEAGPAADIYALGVVLYEMVTGRLPFPGNSPMAVASRRLVEAPRPPSEWAPGLDPRWEAAILRCMERDPQQRFAAALDVASALHGEPDTHPRLTRPQSSLAVLGFKNLSGRADAAWLSTALSEMLSTELGVAGPLRVLPGEVVSRAKSELALDDSDAFGAGTLGRLRSRLGADLVVLGSFVALGGGPQARLRLDLRVQDTAEGESLAALRHEGTESGLFELVSRVGEALRRTLGLPQRSQAEGEGVRGTLPQDPAAARLYALGMQRLRAAEYTQARDMLLSALAIEAEHPMLHWALARALSMLGDVNRAKSAARKAFESTLAFPREERLRVEALYRRLTDEWTRAVEISSAMFTLYPEDVELGVDLALDQLRAAQHAEALRTLAALRRLPPPACDDPWIDIKEALCRGAIGEPQLALRAATRALENSKVHESAYLRAYALRERARALHALGDAAGALEALRECRELFNAAGVRPLAAGSEVDLGVVLSETGELAGATKHFEAALAVFVENGAEEEASFVRGCLGRLRRLQGDLAGARRVYEQELDAVRRRGDPHWEALLLQSVALAAVRQGQLEAAATCLDEAEAAMQGVSVHPQRVWFGKFCRAELALETGSLDAARAEGIAALEAARTSSERHGEASCQSLLARIALARGAAHEAEPLAREALAHFETRRQHEAHWQARARLCQALLALGRAAEAAAVLERGAYGETPASFEAHLDTVIAAGRCAAALRGGSELDAQLAEVRTALAEASAAGFARSAFELRLAEAELLLAAGRRAAAEAGLAELERDAAAAGYGRVSREAAALAQGAFLPPAGRAASAAGQLHA